MGAPTSTAGSMVPTLWVALALLAFAGAAGPTRRPSTHGRRRDDESHLRPPPSRLLAAHAGGGTDLAVARRHERSARARRALAMGPARGGDAADSEDARSELLKREPPPAVETPDPAAKPPPDVLREARTRCSRERDGWYPHAYPVLNESMRVCVQQVQGCGDCLFHAIAIGEAYATRGEHLSMYDKSLQTRVAQLRQLAVDTLISHADKPLLMEGGDEISGKELVETVAEQYGLRAPEYLELMRQPRVWGGGPEIIALVTAIGHPIHVYEPVCAANGTEIHLALSGRYGSPRYDGAGPIHILAADDRFPHCGPTEFKLHGEGGNHFLALIPAAGEDGGADASPDAEDAERGRGGGGGGGDGGDGGGAAPAA